MILRGKPNRDYTTIGNALFRDERLAADEVGIMGYLLSLPGDWEVRRPALMRRWKYGRDGIRRVMTNLIRTGWCEVEKTRLSDGRFNVVYVILGAPGPELTEEEVKRALSLVSSEAAETESEGSSAPFASEPPEPCAQPPTCQPGVADQGVASRRWPSKEGLLTTDSENPESTQALWTTLRKRWPIGHMVSPFVCENLFAALAGDGKQAAVQGVDRFLSDCRTKGRKVCDLATYLREKRWDGLVVAPQKLWITHPRTPQGERWRAYQTATGKWSAFRQSQWDRGAPSTEPSEWPPALPSNDDRMSFDKGSGAPSERNRPPENQVEDISELANEMGR